jgi:hypothetical protein
MPVHFIPHYNNLTNIIKSNWRPAKGDELGTRLPPSSNQHPPPPTIIPLVDNLVPAHGLAASISAARARKVALGAGEGPGQGATSATHRSLERGNWLVLLTTTDRRIYNGRIALASSRTGRCPCLVLGAQQEKERTGRASVLYG